METMPRGGLGGVPGGREGTRNHTPSDNTPVKTGCCGAAWMEWGMARMVTGRCSSWR